MKSKVAFLLILLFAFTVGVLCFCAFLKYPGQGYAYILFSVLLNLLLFLGFSPGRIFFDTFIGLFFWLGFWLKFTFRVVFMDGVFNEAVGNFVFNGPQCDLVLLVVSCGISGLLLARFLRQKYFFSYEKLPQNQTFEALFGLYKLHRKSIWLGFVVLILFVSITNIYFEIYQKGSIPRTILPFGLGGVYTWLLLFGLTSFSAVILDFELRLKKHPYMVALICLFESLFSNMSLLSRGMVINISSLFVGVLEQTKRRPQKVEFKFKLFFAVAFCALFLISVFAVNFIRSNRFTYLGSRAGGGSGYPASKAELQTRIDITKSSTKEVFIDRFVGIEGAMAVSTSPNLGWDLWKSAWEEKYLNYGTSFYDNNLITSPYINTDFTKHHFISLPGILAFFFYPGSYVFLFVSLAVLGGLASFVEFSIFKLGGANFILCSLMGQVVAYRFAHFGYVPRQTYLLFGTIYLNVLILYGLNKVLTLRRRIR
jgi:hypothetical protein